MKLFDIIDIISEDDEVILERILSSLHDRQDEILQSEPLEYGYKYEKWLEKMEDLSGIIDDLEMLSATKTKKKRTIIVNRVKINLRYHQFTYGGLKRLDV